MKYDTIGFLGFNLKHDTTEPKEVWKAPFEWEKVWGLICPI